jgi:hypothetical protein
VDWHAGLIAVEHLYLAGRGVVVVQQPLGEVPHEAVGELELALRARRCLAVRAGAAYDTVSAVAFSVEFQFY